MNEKGKMPTMTVIDFHTHAFPDTLAARAIAALEAGANHVWRAKLDGRVSSLVASMDAAGIARSVTCPIATKPEQFDGILTWCLSTRSDRIVPLASIHPAAADVQGQIDRVAEAGLIGIKLHPQYQDFAADEARLDKLYAAAALRGLLVVLHCGFDIAFSESTAAHPHRIAAIAQRHPDIRLVATHLGGFRAWDEVRRHLVGSNIWMETSFTLGWTPDEEVLGIIRDHGPGRILFGTDSPWADQQAEVQRLAALPLSEAEKTAILGGNAEKLLGDV
jgi:uncharacterized protein